MSRFYVLLLARVALIHKGYFYRRSRCFLSLLGQESDLSAILFVCWRHLQRQQMPQGIDSQMHLAAFAPFGFIETRSMPTFRNRLQVAAVQDDGRRLFLPSLSQPQHCSQVIDDRLEHLSLELVLGLLIDRCPRRQVMEHHPPQGSCPHNPTQAIEHFSQVVLSLGRFFGPQCQIGSHQGPFFITDITGIRFSFHIP